MREQEEERERERERDSRALSTVSQRWHMYENGKMCAPCTRIKSHFVCSSYKYFVLSIAFFRIRFIDFGEKKKVESVV